ncbi:PGIC [Symbiodinium sp. KB8]|nr:PGIC [Symbiodinium sp. KB8]
MAAAAAATSAWASRIWTTAEWAALKTHAEAIGSTHLRDLLDDEDRSIAMFAEHTGIVLDYSRQRVTVETMGKLHDLARAAGLESKIAAMFSGKHLNVTEDRAVAHAALRAPKGTTFTVDGKDVVPDVNAVLDRVEAFSDAVRSGKRTGVTGKPLTDVVSIGIGGSYLGPEFVFEALRHEGDAASAAEGRRLRFLANVDPVDVARALEGLDPETTLVVVVSKTFTTAETMLNARTLRDWLIRSLGPSSSTAKSEKEVVAAHVIAVSAAVDKCRAFGIEDDAIFGFWDWVGGRYSVCSSVGVVPLALQYSFPIVRQFLDGAHDMDNHFRTTPLERVSQPPAAPALLRFAAHIQQVDMESNGKRVTVDGDVLPFEAGEINFGEPGTNGQHSFYQLIHQGRVVPCDFIGMCESQSPVYMKGEVVANHDELMSNFFAQPDALARGKTEAELEEAGVPAELRPHKVFPGNRPSSSLLLPRLNAFTCGQLLSLYEHRTAVQGFVWNVPSFDQWGVELGKVLASHVRATLSDCRKGAESAGGRVDMSTVDSAGFVPSTSALLKRYLRHESGKDAHTA